MSEEKGEKKEKNYFSKDNLKKLSKNYWAIATIVLAVLLILVLIFPRGSSGIGAKVAGERVVSFVQANGGDAKLISTKEENGLYLVTISIQDQDLPVYVTKNGEYLMPSLIPLTGETANTNTNTQTTIPKSEKPEVGLYIWSYCPYGVTALDPFANVASLLGNSANFKVYLYYAGHGDFEVQQNKIQACIQDLGYTQYWDYSKLFAQNIYSACSGNISCDLKESVKLMNSLGINSNQVLSCVESKGDSLLEEHYNAAKAVSVTGSPSLVINGVKSNVARTADAYKTAICSAFNNAPDLCESQLDSTVATSSGSC